MFRKIFLSVGLLVVFIANSPAQNSTLKTQTAIKLTTGIEHSDPWGLLEGDEDDTNTSSGVKSSVVVNMAGAEQSAFALINQKRAEQGSRPLIWNAELAAVARLHSQNMAEFKFFSHCGLDNKLVSDRADASGLGRWRSIGENIAFNRGFLDPVVKTVELWLDSPTHKRNMLDANWTESAVGVAKAQDGSYYFTQVFMVRR